MDTIETFVDEIAESYKPREREHLQSSRSPEGAAVSGRYSDKVELTRKPRQKRRPPGTEFWRSGAPAAVRTLEVRGGGEKERARALAVHGRALKVRGRALAVHGRALKVRRRALKVHGRALKVRLWAHKFFARALFWARCIPFGEGPSLSGMGSSLSRARPAHSRARRALKRDATFPLEGATIRFGDGTVPFEGATRK